MTAPTNDDITRRRARFEELGRELYVDGIANRFRRAAIIAERRELRLWLAENDPTWPQFKDPAAAEWLKKYITPETAQ